MRALPRAVSVATSLVGLVGLALGATCASLAHAQSNEDRATARTLGQDGQKALDAKDYKTAEDDFRRADSLVHAPTLSLGLARALAAEGKYVDAQETYKRIIREGVAPGAPAVFQKAFADAQAEVGSVTPHVGGVTITVKATGGGPVANVQVTVDGAAVNAAALGVKRPTDPGSHTVHASAQGFKPADLTVTVPDGGSADAPLTLDVDPNAAAAPPAAATPPPAAGASPAPASPDQPPASASNSGPGPWPWVAFGVGGAGLIVGAITGGIALGDHSSLASACGGGTCPSSQSSNLSSYHTMGLVSTVGFVVAGVGAAAGVVLLLVSPKSSAAPATGNGVHVEPVVGLGTLGAVGTF
jgi:hypothetical protein